MTFCKLYNPNIWFVLSVSACPSCSLSLSALHMTWTDVRYSFTWACLFIHKYSLQGHIPNMFAGALWGVSQIRFLSPATLFIWVFFHAPQPLNGGGEKKTWNEKAKSDKHLDAISCCICQRCSCPLCPVTSALCRLWTTSPVTLLVRLR